jgi:hypothetical protein
MKERRASEKRRPVDYAVGEIIAFLDMVMSKEIYLGIYPDI